MSGPQTELHLLCMMMHTTIFGELVSPWHDIQATADVVVVRREVRDLNVTLDVTLYSMLHYCTAHESHPLSIRSVAHL